MNRKFLGSSRNKKSILLSCLRCDEHIGESRLPRAIGTLPELFNKGTGGALMFSPPAFGPSDI
jgi:hypothetical protein